MDKHQISVASATLLKVDSKTGCGEKWQLYLLEVMLHLGYPDHGQEDILFYRGVVHQYWVTRIEQTLYNLHGDRQKHLRK
jgi:hypothetical protein